MNITRDRYISDLIMKIIIFIIKNGFIVFQNILQHYMRSNQLSKHFLHYYWDTAKTWCLNASNASSGDEHRWSRILFLLCENKNKYIGKKKMKWKFVVKTISPFKQIPYLRCFVQKCVLVYRNKFCQPIAIVRLIVRPTLEFNCSALDYDFSFIFWIHIIWYIVLCIKWLIKICLYLE